MIQIEANKLGVDSDRQKNHQIMIACFQLGGEMADSNLDYMLFHQKKHLRNEQRVYLNGNRQQKKKAEKYIEEVLAQTKKSYKSLMSHLNKFSNTLGASYSTNVQKRESDISNAMYEFTDELFEIK
tara:strand:+ start:231 stop:608 length:378 start_codon:yes stop_codon:yes gene_type:complete